MYYPAPGSESQWCQGPSRKCVRNGFPHPGFTVPGQERTADTNLHPRARTATSSHFLQDTAAAPLHTGPAGPQPCQGRERGHKGRRSPRSGPAAGPAPHGAGPLAALRWGSRGLPTAAPEDSSVSAHLPICSLGETRQLPRGTAVSAARGLRHLHHCLQ